MERKSGKMVKSCFFLFSFFFFKASNKFLISEFFFPFGQILFNLARAFKAHHKENLCFLSFLGSPLATYLIILCLEKEIIVLEKKSLEEVVNFGFKYLYEPWSGAITK